MSEISLRPSFRRRIEGLLERTLTENERRTATSVDALSGEHREVIRRLGPTPLGVAYVGAVIPGVLDASRIADEIANGGNWIKVQAWSRESGLGRWRFQIPCIHGESALEAVRRSVDIIVANSAPFARVQAVPSYTPPAELILDLFVETERGAEALSSVAGVTFEIVDETVELVLRLDVDIHAYVTRQYIDNAKLATVNAPRLAHFLDVLCNQLHARLIESNGLLPADETGFTAR